MSAAGNPVIELRDVRKAFGSNVVIERLDFDVGKGEIVALLGQTGSGKSTVLNIVMGTIPADAGSVRVAGSDPYRQFARLRGKLAVSFQTDRLLPWRTAVENAEIGLLVLGMPKAKARQVARTWLDRVKLTGAGDLYPHQLSGGMRQRVSLARALCVDPELVLLDESFSQLDHVTSQTLRADFASIAREFNKTCLFVTHRIDDAMEMADRVLVLRPGAGIALEEGIDASIRSSLQRRSALHDKIAAVMGAEA
ncbi:MAG: ATP-binding cassette domain-containing protein [Hyphomicrobiaceae bacterium]|nr:MAG: ATP-binding cassette domain-containing protein [Hyphomicrobiaceae bacterium]